MSTVPVRSDVLLVPQCSQDLVYNTNNVPLVNFHYYERLQQKVSHEVDFLNFFNNVHICFYLNFVS